MPKRKRTVEETVQNKLEKYRIDIFKALSSAKAFERKRFSSRLHEPGITANKKSRLDREYSVLKSLDLRQTARNHLHSNLLRIKAIETSTDIPEELRAGIPRSNLSQEEITFQNNVVSVLCNSGPAKQALDRAVADICETLGVPVPVKSKRARPNKRKDTEEQPSDRISDHGDGELGEDEDSDDETREVTKRPTRENAADDADDSDEESEFEGFGTDPDVADSLVGESEDLDGSDEELTASKYDHLLGGSSSDEEELDDEVLAKFKGREQADLDDISSASESDVDMDDEDLLSSTGSRSPSPPTMKKSSKARKTDEKAKAETSKEMLADDKQKAKNEKKVKAAKAAAKAGRTGNSTFLPTLMGGYISGSESASDIEAPPKKRRGQRARQAIWEKKYGASARHLQKPASKGSRDDGWDMKRGAVGPDDQGRGKAWKKGGRVSSRPPGRDNRHGGQSSGNGFQEQRSNYEPKKPQKKDNEGALHPSWEARKKAKEAQKDVAFSGQKIVFD